MSEWVNSLLSINYGQFYFMQVFVIVCLFVLGVSVTTLLMPRKESSHAIIFTMAFPVGISVFIFVGYLMLIAGVPYKTNLISLLIIVIGLCSLFCAAAHHSFRDAGISVRRFVLSTVLAAAAAALVTGGYLPMSVSNDSLYYFWQYPRAIVYYGGLRDQFDNFLTDTGLGAAVIGTLPFLYGFGETFGIQSFFNFNFILFFGNAIYEMLGRMKKEINIKMRLTVCIICAILIGVCTPVYILSHWAMANMYFMEVCFMILYLLFRYSGNHSYGKMTLIGTMLFAMSLLRIEGCIFTMMIVIIASLLDYRGKDIAAFLILPSAVLIGVYDLQIFVGFTVDNPVKFLTPGKAVLQFVCFVILAVYVLFIRKRIRKRFDHILPLLFVGALLVLNLVLLIYDRGRYIANLRAFVGNLFGQSGWGMLPYISIGAVVIILVWELFIDNIGAVRFRQLMDVKSYPASFWFMSSLTFLLVCLAVSFARGDNLDVATGDSGNRVLLQIAPIVVMMFVSWFIELCLRQDNSKGIGLENDDAGNIDSK